MRHRFLVLATLAALLPACNNDITGLPPASDPATETFAPSLGVNIQQMTKTKDGDYYADVILGSGPQITTKSDTVYLSYTGYLKDGTLFDAGSNVFFGPTIVGFQEGLLGMAAGGKRLLVVPSKLGYGAATLRNSDLSIRVPRQSTLVYSIQVLRVHTPVDTTTKG